MSAGHFKLRVATVRGFRLRRVALAVGGAGVLVLRSNMDSLLGLGREPVHAAIGHGLHSFHTNHLAGSRRQRQGEIAVAAIKLEHVATQTFGAGAGPGQHFFAHFGIGLGDHCDFSRIRFGRGAIRFLIIDGDLRPHKFTGAFIS